MLRAELVAVLQTHYLNGAKVHRVGHNLGVLGQFESHVIHLIPALVQTSHHMVVRQYGVTGFRKGMDTLWTFRDAIMALHCLRAALS